MKEIKTGDSHYLSQGLKKVTAWVDETTEKKYLKVKKKLMKRLKLRRLSNIGFYSYFFTKNAPK